MKTGTGMRHLRWTKWYAVLTATVVLAVVLGVALAGCDSGAVKSVVTGASSGSETWGGNGSENNCETGGSLHWILTPGGNGDLVTATLYVTYTDGTTKSFSGYFPGGGGGAIHFDSVYTAKVASAYADFTYNGTVTNTVLTISHSTCNDPTTTLGEETTTTAVEETTTTAGEATTTTVVGQVTSTTVAQATTTTGGDNGSTTSTAVEEVTSTTAKDDGSTTTTGVGDLTTAGRIDTGGGGTSGPNIMLWLTVSLLGALAVALGGSAIWTGLKQKGVR